MKSIEERLRKKPVLLLDGALGTELFRRGIDTRLPVWSAHALATNPEVVREIHQDYIRAGAEIITTDTFRTTTRALGKKGLANRARELTFLAVEEAKEARAQTAKHPVWIAGSVAPLEDCYEPNLVPDFKTAFREHSEFVEWLVEAGVDLILIETMNSVDEAKAAAMAACRVNLPFFVSFTCAPGGRIYGGEEIEQAVQAVLPLHPSALLINCTPSADVSAALCLLVQASQLPAGAYANIGKPEPVFGWEFTHEVDIPRYTDYAKEWVDCGAKIIGGCCGTTPEYIAALKHSLQS